jgi:acyl carrier protein
MGENKMKEIIEIEEVRSKICAMISELAEIPEEEITDEAPLRDLGVDSLMGLEIVAFVEKNYRVEIVEEEIPKIKTLKDILDRFKS